MKKELHIINEISRMREVMGFGDLNNNTKKYINESINGNTKYLLTEAVIPKDEFIIMLYKALTGDDSFAERFGKSVSDQWDAGARNLADVLERNGLDDIGKLQELISVSKGIDKNLVDSKMVDEALKLYFKNNPTIAENILKNSTKFIKDTLSGKDFITILGAANRQLADDLTYVITSLPMSNQADMLALRPLLDDLINTFKNSGLDLNDPAIKEVLDGFIDITKTSDSIGKEIKVEADAPYIPTIKDGQTKAELDAEKARIDAEQAIIDAERKAQEIRDEAEANFIRNSEEGLENAILKLKSHKDWEKAWSPWQKLMEKLGMGGKISEYITRAENILNGSNLNTYQDFVNSQLFRDLERELTDKATSRKTGKGSTKANIDNATGIMASIKKFFGELPVIGRIAKISSKFVGRVIATIISVAIILYVIDLKWDLGDIARDLKDWAWDTSAGEYLFGDPNTDKAYCLRQIEGYYEIPENERVKLLGTPITCANLDQENYQTFISNIKYLKGSSAMDGSGNTVTKKDRFEVTIGGKKLEYEIDGGSTPTPSPTPPTTTPVAGVYTNTQDDFIKWVGINHPGKYGTDYEWEGTAGYYYPNGGTSGNAMTFSSSGWQ